MSFWRRLFGGTERQVRAGDVFLMPLQTGPYGACRVIRVGDLSKARPGAFFGESRALVVATAWTGTARPELSDRRLKEYFISTKFKPDGEILAIWAMGLPPDSFIHIGRLPPTKDELNLEVGSSGWEWLSLGIVSEE